MIEIIVQFNIKYPYYKSIELIFDFSQLWGLKLIQTSTNSDLVIISFPWKTFKKIFGYNPQKGPLDLPNPLNVFINEAHIIKIEI